MYVCLCRLSLCGVLFLTLGCRRESTPPEGSGAPAAPATSAGRAPASASPGGLPFVVAGRAKLSRQVWREHDCVLPHPVMRVDEFAALPEEFVRALLSDRVPHGRFPVDEWRIRDVEFDVHRQIWVGTFVEAHESASRLAYTASFSVDFEVVVQPILDPAR